MPTFLTALRRGRTDHAAVFAEFSMRLLGLLVARRMQAGRRSPRFRVVR